MASEKKTDYGKTLNLPLTDFPMKADLVNKELKILAEWDESDLYQQIQTHRSGKPDYILHDGPPYANGHIHIGTALNKTLKDFVVKSKVMSGFRSPYIPGWDCHGLPIEHQVLKTLGPKRHEMTHVEIRLQCREYAQKFIDIQREEFKRLGGLGDWSKPYLTMDARYEADIVREFGKVVKSGSVYRAKKPVLWCPNDETALAEAEVEHEEHISPSIYVKFPVKDAKGKFQVDDNKGTHVVIWTTTPWTLVANQAIVVHPKFFYKFVKTKQHGELILTQDLIEPCMKAFGLKEEEYEIIEGAFSGDELEGILCSHPWLDRTVQVILGDHVTKEQGTGCVHTAPGHGQEDYVVGQKYGLETYAPVDHRGRFTEDAGEFSGKKVFEANTSIIELLSHRGMLVKQENITHSYPHCWRCKKPVIFRATEQWFISMDNNGETPTESLRGRAVKAIKEIDKRKGWIPSWGYDRIMGMIQNRPDWCISRQRVWGVPIISFKCQACNKILYLDDPVKYDQLTQKMADLIEKSGGADIWFSRSAEALLPKGTSCLSCRGLQFEKENDILDVWFESGVSFAAVLDRRSELSSPADLYLEGSDQHRGWFHSTLLVSLLTGEEPPYKAVLTHGFVVDGAGKKMSKSAGNVIAPQEIIKQYGAEILRLWIAATDFREDIRISREIVSHLVEAYRKIRNTCRFLLGNLYDFDPLKHPVSSLELEEVDRYMLHRLQKLIFRIRKAYDTFEFHTVFHSLNQFCAVDLSAFYLDVVKDSLYSEAPDSPRRRIVQAVLHQCLVALVRLMAPVLSFTSEEIWGFIPKSARPEANREAPSVHLATFPEPVDQWTSEDLASRWEHLFKVRGEVSRELEKCRNERKIGASLGAKVTLYAKGPLLSILKSYEEHLAAFFIVSELELLPLEVPLPVEAVVAQDLKELGIRVSQASGEKCARCWRYRNDIGHDPHHPGLCGRCTKVVLSI